ncbi:hypothetical protein B0H11DRAFT_2336875 [Mycena galericulata]|nr:hypothetical protein B0H11DRAFT_2336875 [Mycena galericulata]
MEERKRGRRRCTKFLMDQVRGRPRRNGGDQTSNHWSPRLSVMLLGLCFRNSISTRRADKSRLRTPSLSLTQTTSLKLLRVSNEVLSDKQDRRKQDPPEVAQDKHEICNSGSKNTRQPWYIQEITPGCGRRVCKKPKNVVEPVGNASTCRPTTFHAQKYHIECDALQATPETPMSSTASLYNGSSRRKCSEAAQIFLVGTLSGTQQICVDEFFQHFSCDRKSLKTIGGRCTHFPAALLVPCAHSNVEKSPAPGENSSMRPRQSRTKSQKGAHAVRNS